LRYTADERKLTAFKVALYSAKNNLKQFVKYIDFKRTIIYNEVSI